MNAPGYPRLSPAPLYSLSRFHLCIPLHPIPYHPYKPVSTSKDLIAATVLILLYSYLPTSFHSIPFHPLSLSQTPSIVSISISLQHDKRQRRAPSTSQVRNTSNLFTLDASNAQLIRIVQPKNLKRDVPDGLSRSTVRV